MALFNEIQVGRYSRYLQKLLAMKGGPPSPTLASDIVPVIEIEGGEELRYLQGWDLFGVAFNVTPQVGQFGEVILRNPPGSNVIAVCTRAHLANETGSFTTGLNMARNTTSDASTVTAALNWDKRGRPSSTCVFSTNQGTAFVNPNGTQLVIDQTIQITNTALGAEFIPSGLEIPILPGDSLYIYSGVVTGTFHGSFWWRERALEDSERT